MLVRRAVVAAWERCPLTGLALACRGSAAGDAAVERASLDLRVDERHRSRDSFAHRPGDLRLRGDREVAADVLEERPVGSGEIVRICREAGHRLLALAQHGPPILELRPLRCIRVDQILDRAVDRPGVLVHTGLEVRDVLFHACSLSRRCRLFEPGKGPRKRPRNGSLAAFCPCYKPWHDRCLQGRHNQRVTRCVRAVLATVRACRSAPFASGSVSYTPVKTIQ